PSRRQGCGPLRRRAALVAQRSQATAQGARNRLEQVARHYPRLAVRVEAGKIDAMPGRPASRSVVPALLGAAAWGTFGLWYQLFRRPHPKVTGRLRLGGLEAPVDVVRDRYGVPHVHARGHLDLAFATG